MPPTGRPRVHQKTIVIFFWCPYVQISTSLVSDKVRLVRAGLWQVSGLCLVGSGPYPCSAAVGKPFSTEGHIENFIAVGGPHIYFVCLNYNFQRTKIRINDNNHVFCQLNLHTIWPQSSIKMNETNVTVHSLDNVLELWNKFTGCDSNTRNKTSKILWTCTCLRAA